MRQVFTSSRLENVEGVAQLLREAGIEVRVTNDRSYKGNRRSSFSYREDAGERPTVWVIRSEDQLRARDLLREAGLIDSTRGEQSHQAPYRFRSDAELARRPGDKRALRIKIGLLVCIAVAMGLALFQGIRTRPAATPAVEPAEAALATHAFDGSVAATPRALAQAVFAAQLAEADQPTQCLRVDRRDAPRPLLTALARPRLRLLPASQCEEIADEASGSRARDGQAAEVIEVHAFRPTSKDAGTVEYSAYHNRSVAVYKTLQVERVEGQWRVVKTVKTVRAMG
ncbi:hypothetical protein RDV84_24220 [Lysobacter yananisis]|uniref:Pathogenicity-like protein n=1 Tax=Lysobacter yananisis TaxID=1003114 RepID=A0ABY9P7I2_9GAMM|nr:hypothetical protein [Lysobacter yananisis]WMT03023.1 hypothetical protein RDV84_24220 [Lysobacter yananisis]